VEKLTEDNEKNNLFHPRRRTLDENIAIYSHNQMGKIKRNGTVFKLTESAVMRTSAQSSAK
jgi:hypothetical protein